MLGQASLLVCGAEAQDKVQNAAPQLDQRQGSCTGLHGNQCLSKVRWHCHRLWDSPVQYIRKRHAILLESRRCLAPAVRKPGMVNKLCYSAQIICVASSASFRSLKRSSVKQRGGKGTSLTIK